MSYGQHTRAPQRISTLIVIAATLVSSLLIAASPTRAADPGNPTATKPHKPLTIAQARRQLQSLDRRAEIASEAFNTVRVHVQDAKQRLAALQADVARQQIRVDDLRQDVIGAALSHFQNGGGLSTSTAFLVAKSPSQFLNSLATNAIVQHQQAGLLAQLTRERDLLQIREQQAVGQLAAIKADRQQMAAHKAALDKDVAAAKSVLSRLKQRQRERLLAMRRHQTSDPANYRGGDTTPPPAQGPVSGRASIAVATALAQVGKPYVYGAAGPYSFDCSGLTMYSWRAAGVSLSHSSSVQSMQGVPVSLSELRPGDLVFYYSPVSHVAMYIGNGMVVHAPHPGSVVQVVPLYSMPVDWARRVG